MADPAFSLVPGTFFPALLHFAIDSPLMPSILDGLLNYGIPILFLTLFMLAVCYKCLDHVVVDSGPEFDDLEAGTLPLLGRRHGGGGPALLRRDPPSKNEALVRMDVYRSDEGKDGHADCVVCLEDFEDGEACLWLSCCEHAYHRACVNRWLLEHERCPICQATVRVAPTI